MENLLFACWVVGVPAEGSLAMVVVGGRSSRGSKMFKRDDGWIEGQCGGSRTLKETEGFCR